MGCAVTGLSYPPVIAAIVYKFQYAVIPEVLQDLAQLISHMMILWKLHGEQALKGVYIFKCKRLADCPPLFNFPSDGFVAGHLVLQG
jgi:hypothetical protein